MPAALLFQMFLNGMVQSRLKFSDKSVNDFGLDSYILNS